MSALDVGDGSVAAVVVDDHAVQQARVMAALGRFESIGDRPLRIESDDHRRNRCTCHARPKRDFGSPGYAPLNSTAAAPWSFRCGRVSYVCDDGENRLSDQ